MFSKRSGQLGRREPVADQKEDRTPRTALWLCDVTTISLHASLSEWAAAFPRCWFSWAVAHRRPMKWTLGWQWAALSQEQGGVLVTAHPCRGSLCCPGVLGNQLLPLCCQGLRETKQGPKRNQCKKKNSMKKSEEKWWLPEWTLFIALQHSFPIIWGLAPLTILKTKGGFRALWFLYDLLIF